MILGWSRGSLQDPPKHTATKAVQFFLSTTRLLIVIVLPFPSLLFPNTYTLIFDPGIQESQIKFLYDGRRLRGDQTPSSVCLLFSLFFIFSFGIDWNGEWRYD